METKTTVIADDREACADVVQHLAARPDCEILIRRLPLGDYQIGGRLLVERKCWPDLITSIVDGRFVPPGVPVGWLTFAHRPPA